MNLSVHLFRVSILVLLEVLLQLFVIINTVKSFNMFQSLFYWKSYCNLKGNANVDIKYQCFNPCFTGSLTATTCRKAKRQTYLCFNPCFTGSLTATVDFSSVQISLFNVSILVLLEVLLQHHEIDKVLCKCRLFQSLFYWKSYCNFAIPSPHFHLIYVSILVLLEVLLQLVTPIV